MVIFFLFLFIVFCLLDWMFFWEEGDLVVFLLVLKLSDVWYFSFFGFRVSLWKDGFGYRGYIVLILKCWDLYV